MRELPPFGVRGFPIPNYEDPETRGSALVAVNAVFLTVMVASVMLRVFTNLRVKRSVAKDDAWIVVATVR